MTDAQMFQVLSNWVAWFCLAGVAVVVLPIVAIVGLIVFAVRRRSSGPSRSGTEGGREGQER